MPYTLGLLGIAAPPRPDGRRAAHPDPGRAAVAGQPAAGLPVLAPLPAAPPTRCDAEEPRAARRSAGVDHVAACHYAEELAGDVAAAEVFETAETDSQAIEQLDQLGDLERPRPSSTGRRPSEAEERA